MPGASALQKRTPGFTPATGESFGTKLRRLALAARANDPFLKPTWTTVPAWTASTTVYTGQVRQTGGNLYICLAFGTTGTTAPTTTLGRSVTDGSAIWAYLGRVQSGPTEPTAPVYTAQAGTFTGLTANTYYGFPDAGVFRYSGFYTTLNNTAAANLIRFSQASGNLKYGDGKVSFWTDAARFALNVNTSSNIRVRIDGRFYSLDTINPQYAWHQFDFTTTGGRKPRLIELDINRATTVFIGVAVAQTDSVWAPTEPDPITACWISDSIWDGSSYGPMAHSVPQIVGAKLGWSDNWNMSIGGTGWLNPGAGPYYTFRQRVTEALTRNPDVILFQGSLNDGTAGNTAAQITAEVLTTLQTIRAAGSKALIIVLGVWSTDASGGIGNPAVEAAVKAGVAAFVDPLRKTYFIPIEGDPYLPWVTTTNNNSARTTSVNYTQILASDNTHPTESGTMYLAERTVRAITANVLPQLV